MSGETAQLESATKSAARRVRPTARCMTKDEVADALRISRRTLNRHIQDGEIVLPWFRIGSSVRVLESDLERWLRDRSATATTIRA